MSKIIGGTTMTPVPRSDWNQNDPNKVDFIKNKPSIPSAADDLSYDNSISGLTATNVQDAIDEIIENTESIINVPFVLYASAWSNGVQTVEIEGMSHDKNGILSMGNGATDEHESAVIDADFDYVQADGSMTFTCQGTVPTIDILLQITMGAIVSDVNASGSDLPKVTTANNGAFLRVVNGVWAAVSLTNVAEEGA